MRNAVRRAIESVRDCGVRMGTGAQALRVALPTIHLDRDHRTRTLELCDQLSAASDEVASGVAGLDAVSADSGDEIREMLRTLSTLEAQAMQVLAGSSLLAESLEQAAELDEALEPAYVLVVETAGGLLQSFERAKSATEDLRAMLRGTARNSAYR